MNVLPSVDFKILLIQLKSNAIPNLAAEEHLRAVHKIEHHIFQIRLQRVVIYLVKVDFILRNYLDPYISSLKVNLALLF